MKIIYIYIILSFSSISVALAQTVLTLDAVVAKAELQALGVKTAKADALAAAARNRAFKAQLKPQVGLSATLPNYAKTSIQAFQPNGSIAFVPVSQNNSMLSLQVSQVVPQTGGRIFGQTDLQRFDNFSASFHQYNGIPVRVGFEQPLWGYNSWRWERKRQPILLTEAQLVQRAEAEEAKLQATIRYFDVLIAHSNKNMAKKNAEVNQKLLGIADERLKVGKASKSDRLQLDMQYKNAQLNAAQAELQLQNTLMSLFSYLGEKIEGTAPELARPSAIPVKTVPLEEAVQKAFELLPQLITLERNALESQALKAQTKAELGPQATLVASIGFARGSQSLPEVYTQPYEEQQVRLSLNMPLVDWGRKKNSMLAVQQGIERIEMQKQQTRLDLETNVRQLFKQFEQAQEQLTLLRAIQDNAEERFNISNERYVLGDISLTDLFIAQRDKDQSQRDYILGLRNYWVTYYQLNKLTPINVFN